MIKSKSNIMKKYSFLVIGSFLAFTTNAQFKNQETKQFQVKGNCTNAKQLIEKAGNQPRISKVDFDATTQIATISYNKVKTNSNEILKNIAIAGFDNAEYMAPDEAYAKLGKDCQYTRDKKMTMNHQEMDHSTHNQTKTSQQHNQLSQVFDAYFLLKDAFVKANENEISKQITAFSKSISTVEMGKLSHESHMVWMEVLKDLETTSKQLSQEKNIEKQRTTFAKLSQPMFKLAQKANLGYTLYYQNCPMFNGGSNWLSKDSDIKNPFYGNMMLTCGSTVDKL
ncbi:MAG TPA: mercury transporter [Flavobacteriaceae bacterium]|nr:mercury transporter [Flavobacteriaceae bacterium]